MVLLCVSGLLKAIFEWLLCYDMLYAMLFECMCVFLLDIFLYFFFIIYLTFLNFRCTFGQTLHRCGLEFLKKVKMTILFWFCVFFARSKFDKIVARKKSSQPKPVNTIIILAATVLRPTSTITTMTTIKLYSLIHLLLLLLLVHILILYELNYILHIIYFEQFFSSYFRN